MAIISDNYQLNSSPSITITGTEKNSTSLELQSAGSLPLQLSGFVFDTTIGGVLISGALVSVYDTSNKYITSAYTDESGYYSITTLGPGDYLVTASKSGYIPAEQFSVTIDTSSIEQFIALQPFTSTDRVIYGVVTDTDSTPIEGARIDVISNVGNVIASTFSTADGEYSVYGISDGLYSIIAAASGYNSNLVKSVDVSDTSPFVNADIQLKSYTPPTEKAVISGFITDDSANPIANAWVGLYIDPASTNTLIDTTTTTTSGYYIFTEVNPGDYVIKSKAVN